MATYRRARGAGAVLALALAVLALGLAGCGSSATPKPSGGAAAAGKQTGSSATVEPGGSSATAPSAAANGSFAWLAGGHAAGSEPGGALAAGALAAGVLARPSGWQPERGDPGSVSFVRLQAGTTIGYLNATPRSGDETLANWSRFRVGHNAEEGDRDVHRLASATGLRVGSARVSCVIDDYRTSLSAYREIACLVVRPTTIAVVLGAAPPGAWAAQQPVIERALADFVASR